MHVEEAEKLMCPFGGDCVAYQCMAWRWNYDVDGIENRAVRKENFLGRKGND